jgi:MoxR-like ATPase
MTESQGYTPIFNPALPPHAALPAPEAGSQIADRAEAGSYVFDADLILAVNVALATGRPLLLRGRPGTGKSSLAASVAHFMARRFYAMTITSRTQARDLLWTLDDVARLSDATAGRRKARDRERYLEPGPLWWAFAPESAHRRGLPSGMLAEVGPAVDTNLGVPGARDAVVLLDEIDKADPDVPNDLLEPLGWYQFRTERGEQVTAESAPLVVITTNEERELPKAFLRRCVTHRLPMPTTDRLVEIATSRFGPDSTLYLQIAQVLPTIGTAEGTAINVSIAEYLDVVRASRRLKTRPGEPGWQNIVAATVASGRPDS